MVKLSYTILIILLFFDRARLISTSILVAFLAFWWHKPDHHLIVIFERYVVERLHEIINFLTKKHIRRKEETEVILNPRANVSSWRFVLIF